MGRRPNWPGRVAALFVDQSFQRRRSISIFKKKAFSVLLLIFFWRKAKRQAITEKRFVGTKNRKERVGGELGQRGGSKATTISVQRSKYLHFHRTPQNNQQRPRKEKSKIEVKESHKMFDTDCVVFFENSFSTVGGIMTDFCPKETLELVENFFWSKILWGVRRWISYCHGRQHLYGCFLRKTWILSL